MGTTITQNQMSLKFEMAGDNHTVKMCRIEPTGTQSEHKDMQGTPNFHLSVVGDSYGSPMEGCSSISSQTGNAHCTGIEETENGLTIKYFIEKHSLEVVVTMEFIKDTNVIRQKNIVLNKGEKDVTLTHFSSANITGLCMGGLKKWYDNDKIKVHYCMSHWQGEAQWREDTLEHLGVYPQTAHSWDISSRRFSSVGSWNTGRFYPLVLLEDTETGQIWYMEIEGAYNWTIEIGNKNGKDGGTLFMEANCADETAGGFLHTLKPKEQYETASAVFGCVDGSFEEAVRELTKYKRSSSHVSYPNKVTPAFFNDYMNCLWGNQSAEALIPLIDSAEKAGIEVFCLDAGWYKGGIGTWEINNEIFGEKGLQGIFDRIQEKGMLPGIWLEIESCVRESKLYSDGFVLKRNGGVIGGDRAFVDFTNEAARTYLRGVIDRLYSMGVRFIKNDYNLSTLIGAEIGGSCPAVGLRKTIDAFYDFIDEVQNDYPDLMMENCGSGAMRCDNGTLSRFHLQSTSDQEFYYKNPSIASGTLAYLAPEKAGIWSYPYPISYYERPKAEEFLRSKEYKAKMADGEQTIFNMINSLCGTLYLSGRIDTADRENAKLIREGVSVFKKYRSHNASAYPIWPCGRLKINDDSFSALGLISENNKKITLAVFRINTATETLTIDLSKWTNAKTKVKLAYPSNPKGTEYVFNNNTRSLTIKLPKNNSARYFEINN